MINHDKRNTLKKLSVGAATMATPIALSNIAHAGADDSLSTTASIQDDLLLRFHRSANMSIQRVSLHNSTDEPISLKHVYPGLIGVGEHIFDINHMLVAGAVVVPARSALEFTLEAIEEGACECDTPHGIAFSKPLHVVTHAEKNTRVLSGFFA